MVTFEVPGRCVPAPRMTIRKAPVWSKKGLARLRYFEYRERVAWAAKAAGVHPTDKRVSVRIEVFLYGGREGDLDNYQKTILDALNGVAWRDDRQVVEIWAIKGKAETREREGVRVTVDTIDTPEKEAEAE